MIINTGMAIEINIKNSEIKITIIGPKKRISHPLFCNKSITGFQYSVKMQSKNSMVLGKNNRTIFA